VVLEVKVTELCKGSIKPLGNEPSSGPSKPDFGFFKALAERQLAFTAHYIENFKRNPEIHYIDGHQ
jgi:hypothetical protein